MEGLTKNPFLNAGLAAAYIVIVVLMINALQHGSGADREGGEGILIPIAMLSLLVLSVAIMGYLFALEPIKLYVDGKREEAVRFFLKTVSTFAVITLTLLALVFAAT